MTEQMNTAPQGTPAAKGDKPRQRGSPLLLLLIKVGLLAALLAGMLTFVLGVHIQRGNRMYPAIRDGDLIITYKLEKYRVGDVVAYRRPDTGEISLSRIVAMGESSVQVTDEGELRVNGVVPEESVFYPTQPLAESTVEYPYALSQGGYFLLDDYRTVGSDSRTFGQVEESELQGKVVYVLRRRGI